jgi:L-serine deaminase
MTHTLDELRALLDKHEANMARVRACREGNWRLPPEDEMEIRYVNDVLGDAAVNALPGLIESARRAERLEAALQNIANPMNDGDEFVLRAEARAALKGI